MVPKKEIHTYIVKAKVTGTNQTSTTVLRYSIGGLERHGAGYVLFTQMYVLPSRGSPVSRATSTDRQTDRQTDGQKWSPPFNPPL